MPASSQPPRLWLKNNTELIRNAALLAAIGLAGLAQPTALKANFHPTAGLPCTAGTTMPALGAGNYMSLFEGAACDSWGLCDLSDPHYFINELFTYASDGCPYDAVWDEVDNQQEVTLQGISGAGDSWLLFGGATRGEYDAISSCFDPNLEVVIDDEFPQVCSDPNDGGGGGGGGVCDYTFDCSDFCCSYYGY
jgi:hypothetical protein